MAKGFSELPRIIFTEHGRFYPDRKRLKRIIFNPFLAKLASEIVSISEATKEAMVRYDNFPKERIGVIYNGVELGNAILDKPVKRMELNISPKEYLIVTAGRLDSIKNHQMLLRTMMRVIKSEMACKLFIIGGGAEYDKLVNLIKRKNLSISVFLMGYRTDVKEIFSVADLFVLSSKSEGTSITLLEAMSAGLPTVVTNVGGNPEVVEDNVTGFLIDSDDDRSMADKILWLYQNRDIAKKMGDVGRERASTLFSFDKMMKKYEELYIKCAG